MLQFTSEFPHAFAYMSKKMGFFRKLRYSPLVSKRIRFFSATKSHPFFSVLSQKYVIESDITMQAEAMINKTRAIENAPVYRTFWNIRSRRQTFSIIDFGVPRAPVRSDLVTGKKWRNCKCISCADIYVLLFWLGYRPNSNPKCFGHAEETQMKNRGTLIEEESDKIAKILDPMLDPEREFGILSVLPGL